MSESERIEIQRVDHTPWPPGVACGLEETFGFRLDAEAARRFTESREAVLFVALAESPRHGNEPAELVGYAIGYRLLRFDRRHAGFLLYDIEVAQSYRRRGVGTALFDAIRDHAADMSADELWLATEEGNRVACWFYESQGCRREEEGEVIYILPLR